MALNIEYFLLKDPEGRLPVIDEVDASTTYIGYRKVPGDALDAASWIVYKMSKTTTVTTVSCASQSFSKKWTDRATLEYTGG